VKTMLRTPDNPYWRVMSAFIEASGQPAPEPAAEPEIDPRAPVESMRANSDWIGLHDDGGHGLPDWRTPFSVTPATTDMGEYAASRSMPDAPQAGAGKTRINASPYRAF
jgi:hypothetical protein